MLVSRYSMFSFSPLELRVGMPPHCNDTKNFRHRIDRVLGIFSSRPNWDSPTPHLQASLSPLLWFTGGGGVHTRLRERACMVRSQFRRGDRLCGSLGIYELCARNSWEPGILAKVWTLGKVERLGIERTSSTVRRQP
jgi:hypothetical protein